MRTLIYGTALLFSISLVNSVLGQYGDYGNYGRMGMEFDTDWVWLGSDVVPGRPKFKISQHPDGYSIQAGMYGFYGRARYSGVDNSIDFTIMDYKGSMKYKFIRTNRPESEFEGEFEVVSGDNRHAPVDATIKVTYKRPKDGQYASPMDPHDLELSFTNKINANSGVEWGFADERMTDPQVMNMVIKASINPRNFAESTFNFNMDVDGKWNVARKNVSRDSYEYRYGGYGARYERAPGLLNISASLMIINVVEPTPSERQPKITMALDLEKNVNIPSHAEENKVFKKSILLDGMINLTGKGARLGVMKISDAGTGNSIGRIQARRSDSENLRLEFFQSGALAGALNYYKNSAGMSNITLEHHSGYCPNATTFRVYERFVGGDKLQQRFYQDMFFIGAPCHYIVRNIEGDRGLIWEEKLSTSGGAYMYNVLVGNGYYNNFYVNLENIGQKAKFEVGNIRKRLDPRGQLTVMGRVNTILELKPNANDVGEYDMKLDVNGSPIFDGWFYGAKTVQRYAAIEVPILFQRAYDNYMEMHNETLRALTQYV